MRDLLTVLVTGSRDWTDTSIVERAVKDVQLDYPARKYLLIHGVADGADKLTRSVTKAMGWDEQPYPITSLDWGTYGNGAGPRRNQIMVDQYPDICLAFVMPCSKPACRRPQPHISHGTDDCMRRARLAGVPVREYPMPNLTYELGLF